jgi:general stress protein CsbA
MHVFSEWIVRYVKRHVAYKQHRKQYPLAFPPLLLLYLVVLFSIVRTSVVVGIATTAAAIASVLRDQASNVGNGWIYGR